MKTNYDALIFTTVIDYLKLQKSYDRLLKNIPARRLLFVGSKEVGKLVKASNMGEKVGFIDEDEILPFSQVQAVITEYMQPFLQGRQLPKEITSWYYQQFLKMLYARICKDTYYLVWDGDTIPCVPFSMFSADSDIPYFDMTSQHSEEYFATFTKLLPGMGKCIGKSFVAEHMLINCEIMKHLMEDIEGNRAILGDCFWEKIIHSIDTNKMQSGGFSEFETYGTYVCLKHQGAYRLRDWRSFRLGGEFFDPDTISEDDYEWLGHDFDAISFEKDHFVKDNFKNLFDNKEFQTQMSASQMLQIAEEEIKKKIEDEEYLTYEHLGDYYLAWNSDQAYLCYENAAFLCSDNEKRKLLNEKKEKLYLSGKVTVQKVAFVIVSYNNMYLMQKCLESIRKYCAPGSYSVVVIDNASTDGVARWLEQQPDITLILSDENVGFPIGCNAGIQYADPNADIFLLNNDTRMTHNALFWLRMGLYENSHIGATGAMVNYSSIDQLEDVVFSLPKEYLEYGKKINIPCDNPYEEKCKLGGFAMLVKRQVLNEVGTLDEAFTPGYFEDDDFSMRIHAAGYRLLVCHNSFIYHVGSQSFVKRNDLNEIFERSHRHIIQKWGFDSAVYCVMTDEEYEAIQKITHNKNDHFRLLEIGAGNGNALSRVRYLYPNAEVFGIETNRQALKYAVETVPIISLDWRKDPIPFLEQFFDYIIYNKRGEEVAPKEEVSRFWTKYLKEEGKLLFTF